MKHLKTHERFLIESLEAAQEESLPGEERLKKALENTERFFKSPPPDRLNEINGWSLGYATWTVAGIVSYFKEIPREDTIFESSAYIIVSCTPMWEGEDELPIQITVDDEGVTETVYTIENVSETLGVDYDMFLKNVTLLIEQALEIAVEKIKERVIENPLHYFGEGTIADVSAFFNGDLSWYPGGREALTRKLKSTRIRRDLF